MIAIYKEDNTNLEVNLNVSEANLSNADEFKIELLNLFNKEHKKIILNLEQVEYIDSSFLGALVSVLKYVISFQSDLILVGLTKDIAGLFTLIRLDKVFKIYNNFGDVPTNY